LEELAKAERMQIERLRKLMLEMSNTTLSSTNDDSCFLNSNTTINTKNNSMTLQATNLTQINESASELDVEIVNFDHKTSRPPPSVYVVKENEQNNQVHQLSTTKSLSNVKLKQTTELIANFDGEIISRPSDIYTRLNHHKLKVSKSEPAFAVKKGEAYTIPVNVKSSEPARPIGEGKLSLQDAFRAFKAKTIQHSQQRQIELRKRNEERRQRAEFERHMVEINLKYKEEERRKAREAYWANYMESLANQRANRRVMTAREIRDLSRKNYEKLPEVKEKLDRERIEKERKMNKIKASIYTKVN
jgi:hypothetical protein